MKETRGYLTMWRVSLVFFALGTVCFTLGMFLPGVWPWIICFIMFGLFIRFYIPANKHLVCEGGYTVIQAIHFYKECSKTCGDKFDSQICLEKAKEFDYSKNLSPEILRKMFFTGQRYSGKGEK